MKVNHARRAEIGVERRRRTRGAMLTAGFRLIGQEEGQFQRIEDLCEAAEISRGTFYNYFNGIGAFYEALSFELSSDFELAVEKAMQRFNSVAGRTGAAIRYHLHAAKQNPRWGWAMIHTSIGEEIFGPDVAKRVKRTIQEGIDREEFHIANAETGKSLLLGASLGATLDILYGRDRKDYPESVAYAILLGLGVSKARAGASVRSPLPELEPIASADGFSPVNFWSEAP
jgi:AcrR family transcriptional regulator